MDHNMIMLLHFCKHFFYIPLYYVREKQIPSTYLICVQPIKDYTQNKKKKKNHNTLNRNCWCDVTGG